MSTIRWSDPVNGNFNDAGDWRGGVVPAAGDRVVLGRLDGTAYTVTASFFDATVRAVDISSAATLAITGHTFTVSGTLNNRGTILLNPLGGGATLAFKGVNTLEGGGNLILGDSKSTLINPINGTAGQSGGLINVDNTISGAGRFGGHGFFLQNQAAGVVNADGVHALVLRGGPNKGHFVTSNAGLIEATGAGGLTIKTGIHNTATGVISAGDGSKVRLIDGAIYGGTLTGAGLFLFKGGVGILDGRTASVNNQAMVLVAGGTTLELLGAIDNSFAIALARNATLSANGPVGATLIGGGAIHLRFGDTLAFDTLLTNVDNVISGAGLIGRDNFAHGLPVALTNGAAGVIDADSSRLLTLDVSINTIANAGTIEATGGGRMKVRSLLDNTGLLATGGDGTIRFNKAVTGKGSVAIGGGAMIFKSFFVEDVAFTASSGALELYHSQGYTGAISGFSLAGGTSLDLRDIGFTSADEATFSGDATSGVLTVTDGTRTSTITLIGDYTGSTFVASDDGLGGVSIVDTGKAMAQASPPHRFVAAMAGLGGSAGGAIHTAQPAAFRAPMLLRPRQMIA